MNVRLEKTSSAMNFTRIKKHTAIETKYARLTALNLWILSEFIKNTTNSNTRTRALYETIEHIVCSSIYGMNSQHVEFEQ